LNSIGKYYDALFDIDKSLLLNNNNCAALGIKGNVLFNLCKYDEAEIIFKKILTLDNNNSDALTNLANAQKEQGKIEEAYLNYNRSISINPNSDAAFLNYGIALMNNKSFIAAKSCYENAILLNSNNSSAHYFLGLNYDKMCDLDNSLKHLKIASNLGHIGAIWCLPFVKTNIYNNISLNVKELQTLFINELNNSYEIIKTYYSLKRIDIVGSRQPFDFSYTLGNNKELFLNYGKICTNLMSDLQNKFSNQYITNKNKDKIKIAIVGEHIRNHSVWNIITKGIIKNLDKNKFELHIYHLGKIYDEETSLAIDQSYKYNNELGNVEQCAKKIVDDSINVII
jgi:tetratricopeptide (TPR) repeat protein